MILNDIKPIFHTFMFFYIHFNQPATRFERERRKGEI